MGADLNIEATLLRIHFAVARVLAQPSHGRNHVGGTQIALLVGVGFAMFGAALSMLRLSPAGARGAEAARVREGQRAAGE
jgi:hypothetical protein